MKKLFTAFLLSLLFCASSSASDRDSVRLFDRYQFISKGSFQFGTSITHTAVSSSNSELMLLLNGMDFSANFSRFTPYVSYAYAKDRAVGISFSHTSVSGDIDAASLDLMNDGLKFDVNDVNASLNSSGLSVFHRWFYGLDPLSRFGLYFDTRLSYTSGRAGFSVEGRDSSNDFKKYAFDFTPGIMVFVRDNISCHLGVTMADMSYNKSASHAGTEDTGTRERFVSRIKLDPAGIVFGISIHI